MWLSRTADTAGGGASTYGHPAGSAFNKMQD